MRDWAIDEQLVGPTSPSHYQREGSLECFDAFRKTHGDKAAESAAAFNCHKYLYRYALQHGDDLAGRQADLSKLIRYAEYLLEINRPARGSRQPERTPAAEGPAL